MTLSLRDVLCHKRKLLHPRWSPEVFSSLLPNRKTATMKKFLSHHHGFFSFAFDEAHHLARRHLISDESDL